MDVDTSVSALFDLHFCRRSALYEIEAMLEGRHPMRRRRGGLDIFTYDRVNPPLNLTLIPPFLIGRPVWDVWIAGWASSICEVVANDFTTAVFHLNHRVHHNAKAKWDVAYNHKLSIANKGFFASSQSTKWIAKNGSLIKNKYFSWETGHVSV
jgi:hypothetical protein